MIDHVEFPVSDAKRSLHFYKAALAPLGFDLVLSVDPGRTVHGGPRHGLGPHGYPRLWIHQKAGDRSPVHIAFAAASREVVDGFYNAALANGGADNGPPAIRDRYHANYYAAYVLDPDGNNIEAVCQSH
ncbi:VOC family protein [Agrobacterium sp. DKPNP3]|uniref:VOC family protein n=1 Tax=Agrobacterium sp. DKPNP3 TaxID=3457323 RepID=UPI004044E875